MHLGTCAECRWMVQSQECWWRRGRVAGTGGETAGGEVVKGKKIIRGQLGFIIKYLHDA